MHQGHKDGGISDHSSLQATLLSLPLDTVENKRANISLEPVETVYLVMQNPFRGGKKRRRRRKTHLYG